MREPRARVRGLARRIAQHGFTVLTALDWHEVLLEADAVAARVSSARAPLVRSAVEPGRQALYEIGRSGRQGHGVIAVDYATAGAGGRVSVSVQRAVVPPPRPLSLRASADDSPLLTVFPAFAAAMRRTLDPE